METAARLLKSINAIIVDQEGQLYLLYKALPYLAGASQQVAELPGPRRLRSSTLKNSINFVIFTPRALRSSRSEEEYIRSV